ncbi:MAG: hypothetical protein H6Q63_1290 [Firmicutes bacterium]|nr:hypothetical protein [Bacillota bacterium]
MIERVRLTTGKEMQTDKFIRFIKKIYQRTASKNNDEPDIMFFMVSMRLFIPFL